MSANSYTGPDFQLDLNSAIEYNHYLINSYLEERNSRELPLYQRIIGQTQKRTNQISENDPKKSVLICEQSIIDEIRKEFFMQSTNTNESNSDDGDSSLFNSKNSEDNYIEKIEDYNNNNSNKLEKIYDFSNNNNKTDSSVQYQSTNNVNVETDKPNVIESQICSSLLTKSKILELCVLANLPDFSTCSSSFSNNDNEDTTLIKSTLLLSSPSSSLKCDEFLRYLKEEKEKLNEQVTIVSKRLSDMIVANENLFGVELKRIQQIDQNLKNAIEICGKG